MKKVAVIMGPDAHGAACPVGTHVIAILGAE